MKPKIFFAIFFLLSAVSLSFLPSLDNGFVNWDDNTSLLNNHNIQDWSLNGLKKIFMNVPSGGYHYYYHPLTMLTYALEYHFFKLDPRIYHLDNLILHLGNVILVFSLIFLLSGRISVAWITALLFGIHPLRVESVAWVTERKDLLFSFFYLSSLLTYVVYLKKALSSKRYLWLAILLFVLACLSKPQAISLPFVLWAIDYFFKRKYSKALILEKIPFLLIALVFGGLSVFSVKPLLSNDYNFTQYYSVFEKLWVVPYGFFLYLVKSVWPWGLSCLYPYPRKIDGALPWTVYLSFFAPLFFLIILIKNRRHAGTAVFGMLFFLVTVLLPLYNMRYGFFINDRYTYLPSIGLFFVLVEGCIGWLENPSKKPLRLGMWAALVGFCALFSFLTFQRCKVWKDSIALWSDVIRKFPNRFPQAYNNRGNAFYVMGQNELSLLDYNQAIFVNPSYVSAYHNRGHALYRIGHRDLALLDYNKAIQLKPDYASAYHNRGKLYFDMGRYDLAMLNFDMTIRIDPYHEDAYNGRGSALAQKGEYDLALISFNQAIALNPDRPDFYKNRALVYKVKKQYERASRDMEMALRLARDNAKLALKP